MMPLDVSSETGTTETIGAHPMPCELSRREFLAAGAGLVAGAQSALAQAPAGDALRRSRTGMRVGADTDKQPAAVKAKGAMAMLDYVKASGFDGACFRLM